MILYMISYIISYNDIHDVSCYIIYDFTSLLTVYGQDGDPMLDVRGINVQKDENRNCSGRYSDEVV